MATNIFLVRHAHSVYTPEELTRPLSEKGLKDASRVTKQLSKENITRVISSPYKRAIQTVEGTANLFGLCISLDEGFRERKLASGLVDNFEEAAYNAWMDFSLCLPGGESGYTAQNRGVQALENVLDKYSGENIVIGTHGNIMVLIMNHYDKQYDYSFWNRLDMPDIYKFSFENERLVEVKHIWAE